MFKGGKITSDSIGRLGLHMECGAIETLILAKYATEVEFVISFFLSKCITVARVSGLIEIFF